MRSAWPIALFAMWIAGCETVRDARQAQDSSRTPPGQRTPTAAEVGLEPGAPLTLPTAIDVALATNPQVALAQARLDAAVARVQQVDAAYWPAISVSAGARLSDAGGGTSSGGSRRDVRRTADASVGLDQLLFDFGKTNALSRQAAQDVAAARADLTSAGTEVSFSVEQAFFDLLKQRELIAVGEETVRQFERHLEQVRGFVEVGTRVRYDLTKAEVDLGNARLALVKARTAFTTAQATLANALGLAEIPQREAEKPELVDDWTLSLDESARIAQASQPRILAERLRVEAASESVNAAIASLYPSLSLSGSYSVTSVDPSPLAWAWVIGPVLDWLVFAGGSRTGAVREAVANLAFARATKAQVEQQVFLDVQKAYAVLEDSRESFRITDLTVRQAEENLTLVQGRYEIGRASSVEQTDAQVALANAKSDRIQAQYDLQIAIAALKRIVGIVQEADAGSVKP
jgi:outer membrane protein